MIQSSLRITDTYLIRYEFIRIGNDRLVSSIPLDPYLDVQETSMVNNSLELVTPVELVRGWW